ncbi:MULTISPECIES: hypothetical protein [Paenibacillus]|nr:MULTISPECIES: hypothetical protein [Paenibacillus]MBE3650200.1 hypothetical protein [Paenibacillus polymyxa]UMR36659.1 hypothetical protein MJ749_04310 [Paenibacillus polymyxa]
MSSLIADFDANPDIENMIKVSELAIEKNHVFSTKQVIEMIKMGNYTES